MRRCSTSVMESLVLSAITLSGIVLSSDGRLLKIKIKHSSKYSNWYIQYLTRTRYQIHSILDQDKEQKKKNYREKDNEKNKLTRTKNLIPKDGFHKAEYVDLFKKLTLMLYQCRLRTQSCVVNLAQFLVLHQVASIKCLEYVVHPLNL